MTEAGRDLSGRLEQRSKLQPTRFRGAHPDASVRIESLQRRRSYRTSELDHEQAHDVDTLLALRVGGAPLALDHGYPLRLIAPNRPGVMQTKWVTRLVVR